METPGWLRKREGISKISRRITSIRKKSRKKRNWNLNAEFIESFFISQRNFNRNYMVIDLLNDEWKSLLGRA